MKKQEKGLQGLTNPVPEIQRDTRPKSALATMNEYIDDNYLKNPDVPEETKDFLRNQIWEDNHDELSRVISKLIHDNGRMPTMNQIAEAAGLSRQTVHKHLKEFPQTKMHSDRLNQFRLLADRVLANLYRLAAGGDVRAAKVYLDVVGGIPALPASSAPNYIQVNNNIKIDQVTFAALPDEVQQQITGLILQGLQIKLNPADESKPD